VLTFDEARAASKDKRKYFRYGGCGPGLKVV
jgi:hypothetical protein